jgi:hypothetical protein
MGGRSYQIGSNFGRIWHKKSLGGIPGMEPHPREMMRKIVLWLVRQRRGRGRSPLLNLSLTKETRSSDMSRVKCFHCHEHGHYVTNCPHKKKNKEGSRSCSG